LAGKARKNDTDETSLLGAFGMRDSKLASKVCHSRSRSSGWELMAVMAMNLYPKVSKLLVGRQRA